MRFLDKKYFSKENLSYWIAALAAIFFVAKAIHGGNDINVYLHASQQLWNGDNIYTDNPYNNYLYSPLFAILLWPLAFLPWELSRSIWALFNLALIFRLWHLFSVLLPYIKNKKWYKWWHIILIACSAGFIIHNLNLGQMTVLMLWMTMEGIVQVIQKQKKSFGALLIALGINIKIIPGIALGYLFLRKEFRALTLSVVFVGLSLIVPSLIIGHDNNVDLMADWKEKINPSGEKFAFENNNGCHSLNAVIPAYFYEFPNAKYQDGERFGFYRRIASVPYERLELILNLIRIILLLSVALTVFLCQSRNKHINLFWQLAYLMMVSLLVFPHQMKYSMLYFIPALAYVLFYFLYHLQHKIILGLAQKIILSLAALQCFILVIMGRDIIGDTAVNFLDYYHFMGLSNISFVFYLLICNPKPLNPATNDPIRW